MKLFVGRYNSSKDHTNSFFLIDGKFQCYGLEDEKRNVKVAGETRVWDGIYEIGFRAEGGKHQKYLSMFGADFHKGMLEIKNVPQFKYVLIHIGNNDEDTDACYLVGECNCRGENWIVSSKKTYQKIYPIIRDALLSGEKVFIEFKTLDEA